MTHFDVTEFCEKRLCVLSDAHHEQVNAMRCRMKKLQEENARLSGLVERAVPMVERWQAFASDAHMSTNAAAAEQWLRDVRGEVCPSDPSSQAIKVTPEAVESQWQGSPGGRLFLPRQQDHVTDPAFESSDVQGDTP